MPKPTTPEAGILPKKYPELHKSSEVEFASSEHQPTDKIGQYLVALDGRHGLMGGTEERRDRQIAHHVIDPEAIPESYFDLQKRIAREQGHGDIEITDEMRNQLAEAIIVDQTASLERWVDYINNPDADYPAWFRYFTIRSVLKMSDFDKEKGEFRKRSKGTTAQYPDLNREALAYVFDNLNKATKGQQPEDEELQKLLRGQNFSKLYGHAVLEVTPASPEQRSTTKGSWQKFDQTDDPELARQLAESLQGHGTGWCTAGETTAEMQLEGGDFYVYYSEDEDGQETIPRVAIRMNQGQVAEVRGINASQELEPEMADIAQEQLQLLPGGEEYNTKFEHMKKLTAIDNKLKEDPEAELSRDELRFLYELDEPIQGFGHGRDPRIQEIIQDRDKKVDIAYALDIEPEQVSLSKEEALSGGILFHYGDLNLGSLASAEGLKLPQFVGGSLDLHDLYSAEGLQLPQSVGGDLDLHFLHSAEGLELPQSVGGYLNLGSLTSAEGLKLPQSIGGDLYLGRLTSAEGLELPQSVGGSFGFQRLTSAEGLELPQSVGGSLDLESLTSAEGLDLPQSVGEDLNLESLTSAEGLQLPQSVGRYLNLESLTSAEGLELPQSVGGYINLMSLISVEGLELPQYVGGVLQLYNLERVEREKIKNARPDLKIDTYS